MSHLKLRGWRRTVSEIRGINWPAKSVQMRFRVLDGPPCVDQGHQNFINGESMFKRCITLSALTLFVSCGLKSESILNENGDNTQGDRQSATSNIMTSIVCDEVANGVKTFRQDQWTVFFKDASDAIARINHSGILEVTRDVGDDFAVVELRKLEFRPQAVLFLKRLAQLPGYQIECINADLRISR